MNCMRQSAYLVINPITVSLICMMIGQDPRVNNDRDMILPLVGLCQMLAFGLSHPGSTRP